jgi:hypothetical protein
MKKSMAQLSRISALIFAGILFTPLAGNMSAIANNSTSGGSVIRVADAPTLTPEQRDLALREIGEDPTKLSDNDKDAKIQELIDTGADLSIYSDMDSEQVKHANETLPQ